MLQAGYNPGAAHLGTPLPPSARAQYGPPKTQGTLAQAIFDNASQYPDMAVSERAITFRQTPTVLQGMQLSRVPNGGFPESRPHILIGAGPDGIEYNTRLPTMFTRPLSADKWADVGPTTPLTAERPGDEPLYREFDGKVRRPRGEMSLKRWDQENASAAKKQQRLRAAQFPGLFDDPDDPDASDAPDAALADVQARRTPRRQMYYPPPPPPPQPQAPLQPQPQAQAPLPTPVSVAAVDAAAAPPAGNNGLWSQFKTNITAFGENVGRSVTMKQNVADGWREFATTQEWLAFVAVLALVLLLVFFIVAVALAAKRKPTCKPLSTGLELGPLSSSSRGRANF